MRITSTDNTTAAIDLVRTSTSNTDWRIENGGNLKLFSSNNIDGGVTERYSFGTSIFRPSADDAYQLGASSQRWTRVYAVNGTIQTSDVRMKKDIRPISYGLSAIEKMRPVSFNWKGSKDQASHLGLIAQEVQKIIPEVVDDGDPSCLGMNYAELVPVLIRAIQELSQTNEDLKEQNESIKNEMKQIQGELKRIQTGIRLNYLFK